MRNRQIRGSESVFSNRTYDNSNIKRVARNENQRLNSLLVYLHIFIIDIFPLHEDPGISQVKIIDK